MFGEIGEIKMCGVVGKTLAELVADVLNSADPAAVAKLLNRGIFVGPMLEIDESKGFLGLINAIAEQEGKVMVNDGGVFKTQ